MKIQNTLNKIQRYMDVRKYEKHQKELNELVSLPDYVTSPAIKELYTARELLANYARHNTVNIDVFDKTPSAKVGNMLGLDDNKKDLYVRVTNILTGKKAETPVSSDTSVLYPKEKLRKVMVHDTSSGTERIADVKSTTEDTFLKNFYRNIENLTAAVLNKEMK